MTDSFKNFRRKESFHTFLPSQYESLEIVRRMLKLWFHVGCHKRWPRFSKPPYLYFKHMVWVPSHAPKNEFGDWHFDLILLVKIHRLKKPVHRRGWWRYPQTRNFLVFFFDTALKIEKKGSFQPNSTGLRNRCSQIFEFLICQFLRETYFLKSSASLLNAILLYGWKVFGVVQKFPFYKCSLSGTPTFKQPLDSMCIAIICCPVYGVTNLGISLNFLIKLLMYMTKKSGQKCQISEEEKEFFTWNKIIFH